MLYFKIKPSFWEFENDSSSIFRAILTSDGNYLITFKLKSGETIEYIFTKKELDENLEKGFWIESEDAGDFKYN